MKLFDPKNRNRSAEHTRIYAIYELWYTVVDFSAAGAFVIGSVLFFFDTTQFAATWLFLIGSLLFGAKPTIRLMRELRYLRMGEIDKLAELHG